MSGDDEILLLPEEWEVFFDVTILDADGWDRYKKPWNQPISRDEFERRMTISTVRHGESWRK